MAQRQFRSDDTSQWLEGYGPATEGAYSSSGNIGFTQPIASCNGTIGTKALTTQNGRGGPGAPLFETGDIVVIHQSLGPNMGAWELNKVASGGGTTSLTMAYDLTNTYLWDSGNKAQITKVNDYTNFTLNIGHVLSSWDWDGNTGGIVTLMCTGSATFGGTIGMNGGSGTTASSGNPPGGSGAGFRGGQGDMVNNDGIGGGSNGEASGYNGGSGGHGLADGAGAGGGNAAAGENASGSGGTAIGGLASGNQSLTLMTFGGGGGGSTDNVNNSGGGGGGGGGIVLIIAKDINITPSGFIQVNGGGGGGSKHGAGGGAGGSVLLKGQTIDIGTNRIICAGGTNAASDRRGGTGSVGRMTADWMISFAGSTSPTAITPRQDLSLLLPPLVGNHSFFM